jgi:pyruvate kinase
MRRTKIICTIGPASASEQVIEELALGGMNICRLNFSHGDHDSHGAVIDNIKRVRERLALPIGILLDTKGPEIRLGDFAEGKAFLTAGQRFVLSTEPCLGTAERAHVAYSLLPGDAHAGDTILLDDGLILLHIDSIPNKTEIICTVQNSGEISNHKKLTLPGVNISLPGLTDQDKEDLLFGISKGINFVAASFSRRAQDILEVRQFLEENGGKKIKVIAKIENRQGLNNAEEIISVSDAVMVARGDMGVEIPMEDVPVEQSRIIKSCSLHHTPVIVATQMLDSMIRNPMPTRAEVSDVAVAVQEGADCIMLSGETAAGKYPLEALATMARIAERIEQTINYQERFSRSMQKSDAMTTVTGAISHAVCMSAMDLGAAAIVTCTKTGITALSISHHRPSCPILATTTERETYYHLSLIWGTLPMMSDHLASTDEMIEGSVNSAVSSGLAKNGDIVVITAGVPVGQTGSTNLIKIHHVGDILIKGRGVGERPAYGTVCMVSTAAEAWQKFGEGCILATATTDNSFLPFLKKATAIITRDTNPNAHAAIVGLALDIPVIFDASNMFEVLHDGMFVTVDPTTGYVYNGKATLL